jgi:hypothetical protein
LAGTFLQGTQPTYLLRGHLAHNRLLCDLLDGHELVLSAAGANSLQTDTSADRDLAVGRVVLTNELQGRSVREQLSALHGNANTSRREKST